jgi:CheY-like chemotaxis protein
VFFTAAPALVVTDILMPDIDGVEIVEATAARLPAEIIRNRFLLPPESPCVRHTRPLANRSEVSLRTT